MATYLASLPSTTTFHTVKPQMNARFIAKNKRAALAGGLSFSGKIQLSNAAKRCAPAPSCFKTTISCSIAKPETLKSVQSIIAKQLSVDQSMVTPQTKFSDLGADSLDTVEIMMALEEQFGVSVGEGGAENIATVQDAVDLIEKVKAEST